MATHIQPMTYDFNGGIACVLNTIPDSCPICGYGIIPKVLNGVFVSRDNKKLEISFSCVREECHKIFIGKFIVSQRGAYDFLEAYPLSFQREEFSAEINEVSPPFVEIYNQALSAESMQLSEIAGVGYRKALEFLIKDYLSLMNPDSADVIKSSALGRCINDHITDINIQQIAKRAVWLGNDETHYVRRWEGKDIRDLKILTKITTNFIENERRAARYLQEMPE